MTTSKISSYAELQKEIEALNAYKVTHEELMKKNVGEIKDSLNPLNIIKNYLKHVARDNELHQNAFKAFAGIGSKFLIEKILGSNKNAKRHFVASLIENLVTRFAK